MGFPAYFPWEYVVETHRRNRPVTTDSEDELLHPDSDAVGALTPGYRNAAVPPHKEDALPARVGLYQDPSIFAPLGIGASASMPPVTRDLQEFIEGNSRLPKTELLLSYIRELPDTVPNSHKLSASLIWLFFAEGEGHHAPLMYVPGRSWFVYNKCWVEQRDDLLELTVLLQTAFLKTVQDVRTAVAARNISKSTRRGETHHRRKYLLELESDISDALKIQILARNSRHFFSRAAPMDGDPYLLQLQNATVDLRTNTIRSSSPFDYVTKVSDVVVPEYVLNGDPEPGEAAAERAWVYNLIWSIYAPGRHGAPHFLDWWDILGGQNSRNFEYFMAYMARILEGRPLKRTAFLYSPRGRNSKNAVESLLRTVFGTYSQTCRNSIFCSDKKADESNSSITLSRESCRLLVAQEVDTDVPWCNATFKRRSDCEPSR